MEVAELGVISDRPFPRGLTNIGNTCFMNSALQALSSCAAMRAWAHATIDRAVERGASNYKSLSLALAQLIVDVCPRAPTATPVQTGTLHSAIAARAPRFKAKRQHDAHELLCFLLDGLDEHERRMRARATSGGAAGAAPTAAGTPADAAAAADDGDANDASEHDAADASPAASTVHASSSTDEPASSSQDASPMAEAPGGGGHAEDGAQRAEAGEPGSSSDAELVDAPSPPPLPAATPAGSPPTFVSGTFMGTFLACTVCCRCDHAHTHTEPFMYLTLALPFQPAQEFYGHKRSKKRDAKVARVELPARPAPQKKGGRASGNQASKGTPVSAPAPSAPAPATNNKGKPLTKAEKAKQARDTEMRRLQAELANMNLDAQAAADSRDTSTSAAGPSQATVPEVSQEWLDEAAKPALVEWLQQHAERSLLRKFSLADVAPTKCKHVSRADLMKLVKQVIDTAQAAVEAAAALEAARVQAEAAAADAAPAEPPNSNAASSADAATADAAAQQPAAQPCDSCSEPIVTAPVVSAAPAAPSEARTSSSTVDGHAPTPSSMEHASAAAPPAGPAVDVPPVAEVTEPEVSWEGRERQRTIMKGGVVSEFHVPAPASCDKTSIAWSLQEFTKSETMPADDGSFRCSACSGDAAPADALRRMLVIHDTLPPVLMLHLKRFAIVAGNIPVKLSGHVPFPELLDMQAYAASKVAPRPAMYRLCAVVEHSGTYFGGHYTAYVRCGAPRSFERDGRAWEPACGASWAHISDTNVRKIDFAEVLASEAYLLFYEQVTPQALELSCV